jgi:hypothetical protein
VSLLAGPLNRAMKHMPLSAASVGACEKVVIMKKKREGCGRRMCVSQNRKRYLYIVYIVCLCLYIVCLTVNYYQPNDRPFFNDQNMLKSSPSTVSVMKNPRAHKLIHLPSVVWDVKTETFLINLIIHVILQHIFHCRSMFTCSHLAHTLMRGKDSHFEPVTFVGRVR